MSVAVDTDFQARRESLQVRQSMLRIERGKALNRKAFDVDDGEVQRLGIEISQIDRELASVDDAELAFTREERDKADAEFRGARKDLVAKLEEADGRRLDAIRRAEIADRMKVTALQDMLA